MQPLKPKPWPFPATDLISLQKLVNRLPREKRGAKAKNLLTTLNELPEAPL